MKSFPYFLISFFKEVTFIFKCMRALCQISLYTMFVPHGCGSQKTKSEALNLEL